jgi:hypothetical protein
MTSESIFDKKGPFYYPFTKPILGNIDQLCSNPANFGCTLNTNYSGCQEKSKPVLDCGISTSAVCCPETIFPYAKTTDYCTYLNTQGCYSSKTYSWPNGENSINLPCPDSTYDIKDCNMCCPKDITSNLNFTETKFDPLIVNTVGTLWNKDNANLDDGLYKITYNNSCILSSVDDSKLILYTTSIPGPGECGGTWEIKKMTEKYLGSGIYPSDDLKYIPGGYTIYNTVSKKYLTMKNSSFGSNVEIFLSTKPSVVGLFLNSDGSYRIQNAKNQISSFKNLANIGNPVHCAIIDESGNINTQNWGDGLVGKPCGINQGPDQNNYKFHFEKINNTNQSNIPAILTDGEYIIEVETNSTFDISDPSDKCIQDSGTLSNFGGTTGLCGSLTPRFKLDTKYRWILKNESGGSFSLKNKTDNKYLQSPVYGQPITTHTTKAKLNLFLNSDNTIRIANNDSVCLIYDNGTLKGYNWNINSLECGTGPKSTLFNYKLHFVPAPSITIPQVSNIAEGTYEIDTNTGEGSIFEKIVGGGYKYIQPNCNVSCPLLTQNVSNIVLMTNPTKINGNNSSFFVLDNSNQKRWKVTKEKDTLGNDGYSIQNIVSKRYLTLSSDYTQILTTKDVKVILYLYKNPDSTYTIQDQDGACLYRIEKQYSSSGLYNYFYNTFRSNESENACGLINLTNDLKYTFRLVDSSLEMQELTGNGGNCNYTWYNEDFTTTSVSGFSSEISCNNAIDIAQQNAALYNITEPIGVWIPFFDSSSTDSFNDTSPNIKILYTYGGKCISVDTNSNVIASGTCSKTQQGNQPWRWIITPEINNGMRTGNYYFVNELTGQYLSMPDSASTTGLKTVITPTAIGIKLTYPTFGNEISVGKLQPTSYYFHITSPNKSQICGYSDNNIIQSISWSTNTGPVSGSPIAPIEQQQRQAVYECGTNPSIFTTTNPVYNSPNPNYQFTVSNYCLRDFNTCFKDDGTI